MLAGVVILIIALAVFLFNPSLFIDDIEKFTSDIINQNLDSNVRLNISSIDGNFLSGFYAKDINLYSNSDLISTIDSIYINPDISDLLLLNLTFSNISIINPTIYSQHNFSNIQELFENYSDYNYNNLFPFNVLIDNIYIENGKYSVMYEEDYFLNAKLKFEYRNNIKIDIEQLNYTSQNKSLCKIIDGSIIFDEGIIKIKLLKLYLLDNMGMVEFSYNVSMGIPESAKAQFKRINVGDYGIVHDILIELTESTNASHIIKSSLIFNSKKLNSIIELDINNSQSMGINAHIYTDKFSDVIHEIDLNINFNKSIYFDFKLSDFIYDELTIEELEMKCNTLDYNELSCRINSKAISYSDDLFIHNLMGNIILSDNNYAIENISFTTNLGDGHIPFGKYSNKIESFSCDLNLNNVSALSKLIGIPQIIQGDPIHLNIQYNVDNDNVRLITNLYVNRLEWNNISLDKAHLTFKKINSESEYKFYFQQPNIEGIQLDSLILSGIGKNSNYSNYVIGINNITGETIESEFSYVNDTTISIDFIKGRIKDVKFSSENITINKNCELIHSSHMKIDVGEGSIYSQFKYINPNNYIVNLRASQIDVTELKKIFQIQDRINGMINGELYVSVKNSRPTILANLNFSNGKIDDIIFNNLGLQASFRENRLTFSDVDINTHIGHMKFNGWFTTTGDNYTFSENDYINLSGNFDRFEISYFKRYFPWEQKTSGLLSGNFNINGNVTSPKIELYPYIQNPIFDKIVAENISGTLIYKNDRLYIKGLNLKTQWGTYTGTGSIPANLNFVEMADLNIMDKPLDFIFTGKSNSIEFLLPYIDNVEAINGEFTMQLGLSGTLRNPIRGGQISLQNAKLELLQLDNNIESLSGVAKINNNKLVIKKLSGKLDKSESNENSLTKTIQSIKHYFTGSQFDDNKDNLFINGTLDLTEFFNPEYTITIDANDIYINSTYGQLEGRGDAEIFITGKDTLQIIGKFTPAPNNFKLFSFGDKYKIEMSQNKNLKIINYDIHIPLQEGIEIDTDEINLIVDGEVNINSFNGNDFTFSGRINIIDGKFNYNNNEFIKAAGMLILDPSKSSPYAEISAQTQLADEIIDVTFIGFLDNPNLILESSSQQYSQSDILRLLTFKETNFVNDPSASNQIGELLANYMEKELERTISLYTDLDEFNVNRSGSLLSGLDDSNVNIYLGKRISSNLYVNTKINLNQYDKTNEYEIAYRLNRNMSIVARIDENQYWHLNYRYKYKY